MMVGRVSQARPDEPTYFDRISGYSAGRGSVALVGDAGCRVSPLVGFGGSMVIIGAGRLAVELERHPGDHQAALWNYEDGLQPFVELVQERATTDSMSMMCPTDEAELVKRDGNIAAGDIGL